MNSLLLSSLQPRSSPHLASWDRYREIELMTNKQNAVTEAGHLLEYETLVSRLLPPNIRIDNEQYEDKSVLIIDSANRPGTLVEVVQCLTELGLSVKQARISSDGGWFVDEFHVSETPSGRVTDPKKISAIKTVLSLPEQSAEPVQVHTVFQIAGPETPGLLAETTQLLSHNGLDIRTAAAWTYHGRAAMVIGVSERNAPVADRVKLHRLKQLLTKLVEKAGDAAVAVEQVEGPVHHERRLHQLLLADEIQAWKQLSRLQRQHSLPFPAQLITTHVSSTSGSAAAVTTSDTDNEHDDQTAYAGLPHTPKTPRHQWQQRMLPPLWTVDQQGRPIHNDQQQQQQHDMAGAGGSTSSSSGHSAATAPGAAAAAGALAGSTPVLPPLIGSTTTAAAAAAAHDGGAVARDRAAAAAAAAAQQASVDKLIALLQPQPPLLSHVSAIPLDWQQEEQSDTPQALQTYASDGSSSNAVQQQQHKGSAAAAAAATQNLAGLPPRAPTPNVLSTEGSSSSSSSHPAAITTGQQLQHQRRPSSSSASAPSSPAAATAASKMGPFHAAAAAVSARLAATAAGQLSPRRKQQQQPQLAGTTMASAASAPLGSSSSGGGFAGGAVSHRPGFGGGLLQQQYGAEQPDLGVNVQIQHSSLFNYWLVTIRCKDRNKLFFDTVCTLCDMRYDIFHATIDGEPSGWANQLFYIRPRFGDCVWDERRASVLQAMLVSAVQRRFPPGMRVHVFSGSTVCLQDLVNAMKRHKLTITRCKVRAYDNCSHTFSLLNQDGSLPSRQYVQAACQSAGGELVNAPLDITNPCVATVLKSLDAHGRFAFSFINQRAYTGMKAAAAAAGGADQARLLYPAGDLTSAVGIREGHQAELLITGERGRRGSLAMLRSGSGGAGQRDSSSAGSTGPGSYNSEQQPSC